MQPTQEPNNEPKPELEQELEPATIDKVKSKIEITDEPNFEHEKEIADESVSKIEDAAVIEPQLDTTDETGPETTIDTALDTEQEPPTSPPTEQEATQPEITAPVVAATDQPIDITPQPEPNKKRLKLIVLAIAAVLIVLGAITAAYLLTQNDGDSDPAETTQSQTPVPQLAVTVADGLVEMSTDGESWKQIEAGSTLSQGDSVRTDDKARTVLLLDDGSAIRLNHDSVVTLTSLDPNNISIDSSRGEVYSRVVASERNFAVVTPADTYTAQGTAYKTVSTDTEQGVEVYHSAVGIAKADKIVAEGKRYYSKSADKKRTGKVTDLPSDTLEKDAFMRWNLDQDKKASEYKNKLGFLTKLEEASKKKEAEKKAKQEAEKKNTPAPAPTQNAFTLSAKAVDNGINLNWNMGNTAVKNGFKLVYSTTSKTPTFGTDYAYYVSTPTTRNFTLALKDGKTYNLRVCTYVSSSSSCAAYSNTVSVKAPSKSSSGDDIKSGAINLSVSGEKVSWTVGGTAPYGYKVAVSKSGTPSYPNDSKQYISNPGTKSANIGGYKLKAGTYNVRVCKYAKNKGCLDYSNLVKVTID